MRTYEEISNILAQDDYIFDKLNEHFDKWFYDKTPKKQFKYWLKKAGITENEWWMWCAM